MTKLLLIEDDEILDYILKSALEEIIGDYEVQVALNGRDGLALWESFKPDVIVSDIVMPVLNGMEMVKQIRRKDKDTPIIFATAKTAPQDVTSAYKIGVNNYIKKPFLPEELDAHIQALFRLRNQKEPSEKLYAIGKYQFDTSKNLLSYESFNQTLSPRESGILEFLCQNKCSITKREELLIKFWNTQGFYASRSLDVFITKIRRYLSKDPSITIKTLKGVGLILEVE
jgi:DNA-binding response OmpR family regulator